MAKSISRRLADSASPTGAIDGTLSTAAQTNITSLGTLSALTVSGDLTVDTSTLKVDSTNNRVGIGTASPSYQLDLKQADTYAASFENPSDDSKLLLGEVSGDWRLAATYGSTGSFKPITFWTSDQKRMTIDSSGNLLVGGTSLNAASSVGFTAAGQIRQVFASGVANDSLFGAISGVSNGFQIIQDTSNNQSYKFHNGGTASVTIDASGHVGIGTAAPDAHFHVNKGAAGVGVKLETSSGQFTVQGSDAGGTYIEQTGATAATRKFRLQNQDGSNNYTQLVIDGANRRIEVIPGLDVHDVGTVYTGAGPGKGTIHLDPASATDFAGNAITFGASDHGNGQAAHAGIYTRTDGTLGSEMHLSTTDSYAAGSKTGIKISNLGNVSVPRGYITSLQPAFRANYTGNAWTAGSNVVFPHNTTTFNNGGHYSTTTYQFTAPTSGLYHFHFHTIYYGSGVNAAISMRKNTVGINGTNTHFSSNQGAVWQTINITTNIVLAQYDYVDVYVGTMGGLTYLHGGVWNEFSGYLVG